MSDAPSPVVREAREHAALIRRASKTREPGGLRIVAMQASDALLATVERLGRELAEARAEADRLREAVEPVIATHLDVKGALWIAAIDRLPIEERAAWVETMFGRIQEINAAREALRGTDE